MVLEQGIDSIPLEKVAIDDVVLDVVAVIDHEGEIDYQTGAFALAVAAGIRLVGRQAVIDPELGLVEPIHDQSPARGEIFWSEVHIATHETQIVVLQVVEVDAEIIDGVGRIRVDQRLFAPKEPDGEQQENQEGDGVSHGNVFWA